MILRFVKASDQQLEIANRDTLECNVNNFSKFLSR